MKAQGISVMQHSSVEIAKQDKIKNLKKKQKPSGSSPLIPKKGFGIFSGLDKPFSNGDFNLTY